MHAGPSHAEPTPRALIAARPSLAMHARDGLLMEGVAVGAVAAAHGTPAWVYGAETLRGRYRALLAAVSPLGAAIHYAVKANDHLAVLALLAREGAGADVVSGGELARALAAGMAPARIVFSGVGKTRDEIGAALARGIGQINVESAAELAMVAAAGRDSGRPAPIALRINPDIDAGTHDKISTGRAGDKFGIDPDEAAELYHAASANEWLQPVGIALHIGSQITAMAAFRTAYQVAAGFVQRLRQAGLAVQRVDCGGGLGIAYADGPAASPVAYAGVLKATLGPLDVRLMIEPGRWLVGPAGLLLARVVLVKHAGGRRIVVLDAAMNDLARPAMYGAWHGIVPVSPLPARSPLAAADVVGPVCESSDVFAKGRMLPPLQADDLVAILDTGAYGAVMSSTYNARPLAPQVMVDGCAAHLIRPRQALASLWRDEVVPPGLQP